MGKHEAPEDGYRELDESPAKPGKVPDPTKQRVGRHRKKEDGDTPPAP